MKRVLASGCLTLILIFLVSGCERPATQSSWSPIEDSNQTATADTLPKTLTPDVMAEATSQPTTADTAETKTSESEDQLPESFPDSTKGYELYSWQEGEAWNFTLITSTDRMKSFDEIIAPGNTLSTDGFVKVTVTGEDDLKQVLSLLPAGEDIFWSGMDLGGQVPTDTVYLTLPPQTMIDEITLYCDGLGLQLTSIH